MAIQACATNPFIGEPTGEPRGKPRGSIYTPLPRMWIGMALATLCLFFQVIHSTSLFVLTSVLGSCYWIFCIHRVLEILMEHTLSDYSLSPRQAVTLLLTPLYSDFCSFS